MIKHIPYEEDVALKRFAALPAEQKPRFDWRGLVGDAPLTADDIQVHDAGTLKRFDPSEIAETVGSALTDLLLSRDEEDIYTETNQGFVLRVVRAVAEGLKERVASGQALTLSPRDIDLLIEKTLIEQNAHDVARTLIIRRSRQHPSNEELAEVRVIRRNGQVVPWNPDKVEVAVRKAFLSLHKDSDAAVDVARSVTEQIRNRGQAFVHIEDVQDIVQEQLMRLGHFKVAEQYILYRAHRAALRTQEAAASDDRQDSMIVVKTPDGQTFFWDGLDLKKRIEFALIGLDLVLTPEQIEHELRRSLYAEMTVADLQKTIILNAKALIERDADFAKFAGRILLTYIYEEVLGWDIVHDGIENLKAAHVRGFKAYIERGIGIERLNQDLLRYDLEKLGEALDPSADLDFDYLGIQTLYDRYLIVDKTIKPMKRLETPQFFWMRVSMGLFLGEHQHGEAEDDAIALYNLYKSRRFCSSTPTLFNSGTLHSQLSSCYLYKVDDSIESIMMRGIAENAFLSKWAGGLGGSWTAVRGTGSYIKGTNGESQGVVPFLKMHNDQLVAVNQGGKRRGSGCAYLETWHNDVYDFLELRRNTGDDRRRTHDMNTANWIPDLFMKRMENREDWTLFRSNEASDLHECFGKEFEAKYLEYERRAEAGEMYGYKVPAIELWKKMLMMLFETGHPWITFKDACNLRSPQDHAGVIHSSNLCTEITLNTSADETAVCNLGSVVLDTHIRPDGTLDLELLRDTIHTAVRALDNVIDINYYPTEAARTSNQRHRPIGLGVMGLQNALYKKGLAFASDEAVEFNDEFMEAIAYFAYEASSDLAKERGTYSSFQGSKWDRGLLPPDTLDLLEEHRGEKIDVPRTARMDWDALRQRIKAQGMRNSNVLAIAPTATISNIMGTSPCIEPTYKNLFVKSNLSGEFVVLNAQLVRDLKERGLWTDEMRDNLKYFDGELDKIEGVPEDLRERYKTAFGIEFEYVIDAAARRQKWIDQAQSVNLWLAKPDLKTLSHMYRRAWHKGLKTTYYLRTLGASNIEKATVSVKKDTRGLVGQNGEKTEAAAPVLEPGPGDPPASPAAATAATPPPGARRVYTEAERQACSLEAMRNGEECEACQ